MVALLKDLGALTLVAEDLEATKRFYQDAFGLDIVNEDTESVAFGFGNTVLNVVRVEAAGELIEPAPVGGRHAGSRCMFTVWVQDADAMCAELRGRGVTLLNGPIDRPWGQRTATFSDPAGNVWEIAQNISPQG